MCVYRVSASDAFYPFFLYEEGAQGRDMLGMWASDLAFLYVHYIQRIKEGFVCNNEFTFSYLTGYCRFAIIYARWYSKHIYNS